MNELDLEARYLKLGKLARGSRQYTDTSNAERFVRRYGDEVRYCGVWKKWLHWDKRKWNADVADEIQALGKDVVRGMYAEACGLEYDEEREELEKHAMKSEAVRRRKAMVEALSWERSMWVKPEELDANGWLLNCRNGTVDLRTGRLGPHERTDFITKLANAEFFPEAQCPRWRRFVSEIMGGNDELVRFIQKAAGWALTADMREQVVFILHGNGANGKSTFLNTILRVLGDYALPARTETFMKRSGGQLSNDVARLRGTRLVATIEGEEGGRLSESLVKQVTGNDRLTARFLYGEYFDFEPTFKIFIATNHKPVIRGAEYAIWRRIRLIPFTVTIPPEKQDQGLADALVAEYAGILSWLVEGCLLWKREGLGTPPAVKEATERYRSEMNVIESFLRDRCELRSGAEVRSRELFVAYAAWCEEKHERAGSERLLSLRLEEMGHEKRKRKDAHYWIGIGLGGTAVRA